MNTNELSNMQVVTVLAVLFFLMFVIYKTVMIAQNKKNKVTNFSYRKTTVRKPKRKTQIKVKHDTSVFNFTNDSKADYIQSCWDELNK